MNVLREAKNYVTGALGLGSSIDNRRVRDYPWLVSPVARECLDYNKLRYSQLHNTQTGNERNRKLHSEDVTHLTRRSLGVAHSSCQVSFHQ